MKKNILKRLLNLHLLSANLIAFLNSLVWFTITWHGIGGIAAAGPLSENKIWPASAMIVFSLLSLLGWGLSTDYFLRLHRRRIDESCPHCHSMLLEKTKRNFDLKYIDKLKNGICPHCDKSICDDL